MAKISGLTLLSRILGFVRDFVIANVFGAGAATDAFFVAFRLPNLLRRLFAEGAFTQAFVPIIAECRQRQGDRATRNLLGDISTVLSIVLLVVTATGVLASPALVLVSAPGFLDDASKFDLTVALTRITFPYILFMSLVATAGGILNTWSRFAIPAATPIFLNLALIGMSLFAAAWFDEPIFALAWGVFLGGVLQLMLQIPALWRIDMLPRLHLSFRKAWRSEGVRRILKLMGPAVLGVSVAQISLLINTIFASSLGDGYVSWLYYADRLMEFPAALLGASLSTVLLPSLSRSHAANDAQSYSQTLDWGLRLTLLLALPAALSLIMLALPLVATLFMHGAFGATDAQQTSLALMAYGLGLTALILVKILAPGFYARQDMKAPVRIAIISLIATQIMNLIFIGWLKHAGLALAISLAACLNAGLLYRGLRKQGAYTPHAGWAVHFGRILCALLALGVLLWFLRGEVALWLDWSLSERAWRLGALVLAGALTYFAVLMSLGMRLADFKRPVALQSESD